MRNNTVAAQCQCSSNHMTGSPGGKRQIEGVFGGAALPGEGSQRETDTSLQDFNDSDQEKIRGGW